MMLWCKGPWGIWQVAHVGGDHSTSTCPKGPEEEAIIGAFLVGVAKNIGDQQHEERYPAKEPLIDAIKYLGSYPHPNHRGGNQGDRQRQSFCA